MLDQYRGECMVSIININNGINNGYQNYNTCQMFIFGGHVKVRESLFTQVIAWINTILNHINTSTILPRHEGLCMVYIPRRYRKQNIIKYVYSIVIKNVTSPLWIPKGYLLKKIPIQHWL